MTEFETIRVEPERDRYGRYLIVPAKGGKAKSYTRATTIAETLDDRYNLEAWKQRMVALGLAQRPDLYASVASLPHDDKQQLNRLCDQAREAAAGSAGANLGTALHRFTERLNRGEKVKVPEPWDFDILAYRKALDSSGYNIRKDYLERIVVLEALGIAGMFDMLLEDSDGNLIVADLKTGADLNFSWCAITVQEALYSRAETLYDPATKTHEAMPPVDQDKALVIHLPAGKATCTLYEVDIAAGWEAAQHALWTRNWRKRKDLAVPATQIGGGEPAPVHAPTVEQAPPAVDGPIPVVSISQQGTDEILSAELTRIMADRRRRDLIDHIKRLPDVEREELAHRWPVGVPTFKQSDAHTDEQLDAIAAMIGNVDWSPKKPDDPEPEPEPELPPAAHWVAPDEGATLDDATVEAIRSTISTLDKVTLSQVNDWAAEAHAAKRPFSLSKENARTQRRFEIMRAAIALSPYEPDVQRAAIQLVAPDLEPLMMMHRIGAVLGSLSIDEATRLTRLAESLGNGVNIVYGADGPTFDGPGLAAVAA